VLHYKFHFVLISFYKKLKEKKNWTSSNLALICMLNCWNHDQTSLLSGCCLLFMLSSGFLISTHPLIFSLFLSFHHSTSIYTNHDDFSHMLHTLKFFNLQIRQRINNIMTKIAKLKDSNHYFRKNGHETVSILIFMFFNNYTTQQMRRKQFFFI
jgi:hypothetical protein